MVTARTKTAIPTASHLKWEEAKDIRCQGGIELSKPLKEKVRSDILLWKHFAKEGFKDGYIADVVDQYKPSPRRKMWVFWRRVRIWRKPVHERSIGSDSCPVCRDYHKLYPKPPRTQLILKGSVG